MRSVLHVFWVFALWPEVVDAQSLTDPLVEARVHFERGVTLHEHGDHEGAVRELQAAWSLSPRPSVLYNLGVAYRALRRDAEAWEALSHYLIVDPDVPSRTRREVEEAIQQLRASIAVVHFDGMPTGTRIRVAGRDCDTTRGVALMPGTYRAELSAPEHLDTSIELTLTAGESRVLRVPLSAATAAPSPPLEAPRGRLSLLDVPDGGRISIDGTSAVGSGPFVIPSTNHRVRIEAPGYVPWEGMVSVNTETVLRASLAERRGDFARRWRWMGLGATGVLTVATVAFGASAIATHGAFLTRTADDPEVDALIARGRTFSIIADVCGGLAIASAVFTVWAMIDAARPQNPSRATVAARAHGLAVQF
jgi:hypothetical protein